MTKISNKSIQSDWENKLVQWQSSGKSGATWCRDEGINYHVFLYWKKKLKSNSTNFHSEQNTFVEICEPPSHDSGLILELQGVNIRLSKDFDAVTLESCLCILMRL